MAKQTRRDVFNELVRSEGTVWNDEQRRLYDELITQPGEGRGERSFRDFMGMPQETPGTKSRFDVSAGPGIAFEVKCIEYQGTFDPRIRLGTVGKRKFLETLRELHEKNPELNIDLQPSEAEGLWAGELGIRSISPELKERLGNDLRPSTVFDEYAAIVLVNHVGFLLVKSENFDRAFTFAGVSQGGPRYVLDFKDYVPRRLDDVKQQRLGIRTAFENISQQLSAFEGIQQNA